MHDPLKPTLGESIPVVSNLIRDEEENGRHGNASLDEFQLAALRELLALAEDVVKGEGA